jgi:hypothetical protein
MVHVAVGVLRRTHRKPCEPSEDFRRGGRSARSLEVRCCAAVCCFVMAEGMTRKAMERRAPRRLRAIVR